MTSASRSLPSPGCMRAQMRLWNKGWISGRSDSRTPVANRCSRYSVAFINGTSPPLASRTTSKYLDGNSFIITPPFSPSAICVTSGGTDFPASVCRSRLLASYQGCIWATSLVSDPCVLTMATMLATSPAALRHTSRCGRCLCCSPLPLPACSTVCSCTSTQR